MIMKEDETNISQEKSLSKYRQEIRWAYNATSFGPERRAEMIIDDYSPEYDSIEDPGKKEKYEQLFLKWMSAESRCMSSMITGPANFPVRRNQKYQGYAQFAYEKFRDFVKKINKVVVHTLPPEEDLEAMIRKYDNLVANHEKMKEINKIQRSKAADKIEKIMEVLGIPKEAVEKVTRFADFSLRNNLAKIKSTKQRIIDLKNRIKTKETFSAIEFEGGQIDIIDDRVCIIHDERPAREVIDKLKRSGFRWSPRNKYWCRKHTEAALKAAKEITEKE